MVKGGRVWVGGERNRGGKGWSALGVDRLEEGTKDRAIEGGREKGGDGGGGWERVVVRVCNEEEEEEKGDRAG